MRTGASVHMPTMWGDVLLLIKPGITLLVLIATSVGYAMGSGGKVDGAHLGLVLVFTFLVGTGANSLNQFVERDVDGRMARTRNRPIPSGRMRPKAVLAGGVIASLVGVVGLALVANPLSAAIGLTVIITYVMLYTPLKQVTALNTLVGAVPGALPPVLGWAASSGELTQGALALFLLQYVWQPPHVLAIAWRHRHDYAAAGMHMLVAGEPNAASTRRQVLIYSAVLIPLSLYPTQIGIAGDVYFWGALIVSVVFFAFGLAMAVKPTELTAKLVFKASLFYLPALFVLMLHDALPVSLLPF
ncbi:MAG TPA: heme o synthase [bacterium]